MPSTLRRALIACGLLLPTLAAAQTAAPSEPAPAAPPAAAAPAPAPAAQPAPAPAPAPAAAATPAPVATPAPAAAPAPAPVAAPAPAAAPAAPAATAAAEKLSGLAAWSALIGNSIRGKSSDGDPLVEFYAADGTIKQLLDDELSTGKWTVRGETVCFEFPEDEEESCYRIEVSGPVVTFLEKDGSGRRFELLRGNAKGL